MSQPITNHFTHGPSGPPRSAPPRWLTGFASLLLVFGLSGGLLAQGDQTCFEGFTAGPNQGVCAGTTVSLAGGYDLYDEPGAAANTGNPMVTWSIESGGTGFFSTDGGATSEGSTYTAVNFNHGSVTGFADVVYVPGATDEEVVLAIETSGEAQPICEDNEEQMVTLYFNSPPEQELDVELNGIEVVGNQGSGTQTLSINDGDELTIVIDNNLSNENAEPSDAEPMFFYEITIADAADLDNLPTPSSGAFSALDFNAAWNDVIVTNNTCGSVDFSVEIYSLYDLDNDGDDSTNGVCRETSTTFDITVAPRPTVQATLAPDGNLFTVCANDDEVDVVVTGTVNSSISYTIDYGDGSPINDVLELGATGVNGMTDQMITLDANIAAAAGSDEITVTLTSGEYTDGDPACVVSLAETITIDVEPLPQINAVLANSDDDVVCATVNGGPNFIPFTLTTPSGAGNYTFTYQIFYTDFFGNTNEVLFETVSVTRTFDANGDDITGTQLGIGYSSGAQGFFRFFIDQSSVTKNNVSPSCTNPDNDIDISVTVQTESYVAYDVESSAGDDFRLTSNSQTGFGNSAGTVTICDGGTTTIDLLSGNLGSNVTGNTAMVDVTVTNTGNVQGAPAGGSFTVEGAGAFDPGQLTLSVPASQTTNGQLVITFQPYHEDNNDPGLNGDECSGNPLTLTVNVIADPIVTIAPATGDDVVCNGADATINITSNIDGTATVIAGAGGASIDVVVTGGTGSFQATAFGGTGLTATTDFTVTQFETNSPVCNSTPSVSTTVSVEGNPTATISIDDDFICDGDDASTVTFTGTGGTGADYVFTYNIDGGADQTIATDAGEATAELELTGQTTTGTYTVTLTNVENTDGDDMCDGDITGQSVTLTVEDEPSVMVIADDNICSGTAVSISPSSSFAAASAQGGSLFYNVEITNSDASVSLTTESGIYADGAVIEGTPVNTTDAAQTIDINVTAFYFPTADVTADRPNAADFASACQGDSETATITVERVPTATFGGEETICEEGDGADLVITSTNNANGFVRIRTIDANGNVTGSIDDDDDDVDDNIVLDATGEANITVDPDETTIYELYFISTDPAADLVCTTTNDFTFTVNVIETPEASFVTADQNFCEGDDITVELEGTANATVTLRPDGATDDSNDFTVELDADGEGSFDIDDIARAATTTGRSFAFVSVTTDSGPLDVTCVADDLSDPLTLTVQLAPTGAIVSNNILCAGEEPEVQFNSTNGAAGPYDIVVSVAGITDPFSFDDVADGDALDFEVGGDALTLDVTTSFTLVSVVSADGCTDLSDGPLNSVDVVVNPIPVADAGTIPATICSGDDLALSVTGTPAVGAESNDIMFDVTANNAIGSLAAGETATFTAAEIADLNTALGLTGPFVNPSNTDPMSVSLSVLPFFEGGAGSGTNCMPTSGFTGDFAEAEWTASSGSQSSVTFTSSTLVLYGALDGGGISEADANASAEYTFSTDGTVSFDMLIDLEAGVFGQGGSGNDIYDIFIIDFEGTTVYNSDLSEEVNASFSQVVTPNSTLFILLDDDEEILDVDDSQVTISNFLFEPLCTRCEGEVVNIDFDVLPALTADFTDADNTQTICEGGTADVCLTGSPNTNVTLRVNGFTIDVKLDANGMGCITPAPVLTSTTSYQITGVNTIAPAQDCGFSFGTDGPVYTVVVTPTPAVTGLTLSDASVCRDAAASATVTGTANGTVSYSIDSDDDDDDAMGQSLLLDANGEGTITLPTGSAGNVNVTFAGISVTVDGVTCSGDATQTVDLTVRELPIGTLTNDGPVCNGGSVDITFTAGTALTGDYTVEYTDANGDTQTATITDGTGVLTTATVAGTYTVTSITDPTGCEDDGTDLPSTTVVIDEVPTIVADVSGELGTLTGVLNSNSPGNDIFRAIGCNTSTFNTVFADFDGDATSNSGLPLFVQVEVTDADDLIAIENSNVAIGDLDLTSVLGNLGATETQMVTVVLTPYFENDTPGLDDDCDGPALTFEITILPEVMLDFDADKNVDENVACEGDEIVIDLMGSPNGVVTFSTDNLTVVSRSDDGTAGDDSNDATVQLDANGEASVTVTAGTAGTASLDVMMIQVVSSINGIPRTCMKMFDPTPLSFDVTVNEVPSATLVQQEAGTAICNGEDFDVVAMLMNTSFADGDAYTFTVEDEDGNSTDYPVTVDASGKATLFTATALTETTTFTLTGVADANCSDDELDVDLVISVEDVPAGSDVDDIVICANDEVEFDIEAATTPIDGNNFVSATITDPLGFYGAAGTSTVALSIADFNSTYGTARDLNYVGGDVATVTFDLTYYIELDGGTAPASLDADECVGNMESFTITINPRPQLVAGSDETCSGVSADFDFDGLISNGFAADDASFAFEATTVADGIVANGTVAAGETLTTDFTNTTDAPYDVTYTVTATSAAGCESNEVLFTLTVNPEPVITAGQTETSCSGDEIDVDLTLTPTLGGAVSYKVLFVTADFSADFVADAGNVVLTSADSTSTDSDFLSDDVYTNTTSGDVVVTYTVQATSEDGCVGAMETVEVTVIPEPVADPADLALTICSGGTVDLNIIDSLTTNGVGRVVAWQRRVSTNVDADNIRIYDGGDNNVQVFFNTIGNGEFVTSAVEGENFIADSLLNDGTSDRVVFYDIVVDNALNGCGDNTAFTLAVTVVEEADVQLNLTDDGSAICSGMPITLVANTSDGTGIFTYEYDTISVDPGVEITLTPSAAGGEVIVDGTGNGNAVIQVTATSPMGCVAVGNRTISVSDAPEMATIDGSSDPCVGGNNFNNYAIVNPSADNTFSWSLSNPDAGQIQGRNDMNNATFLFNLDEGNGPFDVILTETTPQGCATETRFEIVLFDNTSAEFSATASDTDPLTFDFVFLGGGSVDNVFWDFGDGNTSTEMNPTHTYTQADPSAEITYTVTLSVLGCDGNVVETQDVTTNSTDVDDVVMLRQGVNFISFDVMPENTSIREVFAPVIGDVVRITTVNNGRATAFQPELPNFRNSLRDIAPDFGYVVIMDADAMLTVSGDPVTDIRSTTYSVNYVACLPQGATPSDQAWPDYEADNSLKLARTFGNNVAALTGGRFTQTYNPGLPAFRQTMDNAHNSIGYMIIRENPTSGLTDTGGSENYEFIHGQVSAADFVPGDDIEILNRAGDVIGTLTTDDNGNFASTALYGEVVRDNGDVAGSLKEGEEVSFRYHGRTVKPGVFFHGNFNGTEVNLDFSNEEVVTEIALSVAPNPASSFTNVTLELTDDATVAVRAMDATGRVVKELLPQQRLSAGATSIEWSNMDQLPAGLYQIVVSYEGQILPELTQRVVKQ